MEHRGGEEETFVCSLRFVKPVVLLHPGIQMEI